MVLDKNVAIKKKNSVLGILSFIFSLVPCMFLVGLILAVIDLIKSKKNPRKKVLSIIAIVISLFWGIISIFLGIILENEVDFEEKKESYYSTSSYHEICQSIEYEAVARNPQKYTEINNAVPRSQFLFSIIVLGTPKPLSQL